MKHILKKLFIRTPKYSDLRTIRQRWLLKKWKRRGRPDPPLHIVKQRIIRQYAEKFGVRVLIETGTCYGDMVEAVKDYFSRIYSIELSNELYKIAKRRFAGDSRIKIIHGDSGIELGKLISSLDQPALFWLDGHYSGGVTAKSDKNTPIYEELTHIFSSSQKGHLIIIDDAMCFRALPHYPSIDELIGFINAKNPNVEIEVENNIIRIVPCSQIG